MQIVLFLGAMFLASVIESAIRYVLNAIKAKRELREFERVERVLDNRFIQINAEVAALA